MRILFVTLGSPLRPDRGAQLRDHELIVRVARHHRVSVLAVLEPGQPLGSEPELERLCEVLEPAIVDPGARAVARRASEHLRRRLPPATIPYLDVALLERLAALAAAGRFDVVQLEHSFLAPARGVLPAPCRAVLSLHNIGAAQYASIAAIAPSAPARATLLARAGMIGRLERAHIPRFDGIVVVSEQERRRLPKLGPAAPIAVVPNGVDLERLAPLAGSGEPGTLLFVGNLAYQPNVDAVLHFCRHSLPLIAARRPGVRLLIVGPRAPASVRALRSETVEVLGRADDVRPLYERAQLAIAPLRAGGGTRLKALEAMALGRPLVCTPIAVEGLAVADGREVLIAEPGAPLAARVVQALADTQLRRAVAASARRFVERAHGWDACAEPLLELYEQAARPRSPMRPPPGCAPRVPAGRAGQRAAVEVSVVIPALDAVATLPLVLDALAPQMGGGREVIVVYSGAEGEVHRRLAALSARRPWLRMIIRSERLSPGQARNLGAAQARGALLAFLDADVIPAPGWLDALQASLTPAHDALAGAIDNGTPHSRIGTAEYLLACSEAFPRRPRAIRHAPGANLLVRRERFEALGGFADQLRAGEDTLLTFPLARRGRLGFAPGARASHLNRTRLQPFLANQRLQGGSYARLCATIAYPHGWVARWPWRPLAGPLRLLALIRCLAVNPAHARQALWVWPELLLGDAAWAIGCMAGASDHS